MVEGEFVLHEAFVVVESRSSAGLVGREDYSWHSR